MIYFQRAQEWGRGLIALSLASFVGNPAFAQDPATVAKVLVESPASASAKPPSPTISPYFDPLQGTSSSDLVRRALASNGELAAARMEIERARARLRQAGLRPNPTLEFEQTTGRFTGAPGESEISVGLAVPLELGGKRRRRIELAQAEIASGGGGGSRPRTTADKRSAHGCMSRR